MVGCSLPMDVSISNLPVSVPCMALYRMGAIATPVATIVRPMSITWRELRNNSTIAWVVFIIFVSCCASPINCAKLLLQAAILLFTMSLLLAIFLPQKRCVKLSAKNGKLREGYKTHARTLSFSSHQLPECCFEYGHR